MSHTSKAAAVFALFMKAITIDDTNARCNLEKAIRKKKELRAFVMSDLERVIRNEFPPEK
jgi:hypothetical protein